MPVTTPIAKLISISLPKKRVRRRYAASPLRYQSVWKTATSQVIPIVIGTKMKW